MAIHVKEIKLNSVSQEIIDEVLKGGSLPPSTKLINMVGAAVRAGITRGIEVGVEQGVEIGKMAGYDVEVIRTPEVDIKCDECEVDREWEPKADDDLFQNFLDKFFEDQRDSVVEKEKAEIVKDEAERQEKDRVLQNLMKRASDARDMLGELMQDVSKARHEMEGFSHEREHG